MSNDSIDVFLFFQFLKMLDLARTCSACFMIISSFQKILFRSVGKIFMKNFHF